MVDAKTSVVDDENVELVFTLLWRMFEKLFPAHIQNSPFSSIKGSERQSSKEVIKNMYGERKHRHTDFERTPSRHLRRGCRATGMCRPRIGIRSFSRTQRQGAPRSEAKISILRNSMSPIIQSYTSTAIVRETADEEIEDTITEPGSNSLNTLRSSKTAAAKTRDKVFIDTRWRNSSRAAAKKFSMIQRCRFRLARAIYFLRIENNMLGMKIGEDKTFTVTFPADSPVASLASNRFAFQSQSKRSRRKPSPE